MPPFGRRRSVDSSSSDSDSKKYHRDEKHESHGEKHTGDRSLLDHFPHMPGLPVGGSQHIDHPPAYAPPSYTPPAAGDRLALTTTEVFPMAQAGPHPCIDADGSPVFIGSAIFSSNGGTPDSVHPCKIAPHLSPVCRVPYGGGEHGHHGRYDLLPFVPQLMEWVSTSRGQIPPNRRPVDGGVENNGAKLFHAMAKVGNIWVPGKTGIHLVRATSCHARLCVHVFDSMVAMFPSVAARTCLRRATLFCKFLVCK